VSIINRAAELHDEITAWRRDLHENPELDYDVHRTAGIVADKLRAFGCDEVVPGIGKTGRTHRKAGMMRRLDFKNGVKVENTVPLSPIARQIIHAVPIIDADYRLMSKRPQPTEKTRLLPVAEGASESMRHVSRPHTLHQFEHRHVAERCA
jgi:hypothetical protein